MSTTSGIPKGAIIAINDMLMDCGDIKSGQEVLILAHVDGLYGGDNLVDKEAIDWIQTVAQWHGANVSVLWIDEIAKPFAWRFPPVVKAAAKASNLFINNSFDIVHEELIELKKWLREPGTPTMIRNFAVTAPLLCTAWAQTPYELVSEIRRQVGMFFKEDQAWQLTDPNGTHLEGKVNPVINQKSGKNPEFITKATYAAPRGEYRPWPEWLHRPVRLSNTTGIFVFETMLGWWSRYIGISPYFSKPIRMTIDNNRITKIEGGDEAAQLDRFLSYMKKYLGEEAYSLVTLHSGIHPQARVSPQQCPHILYRRLIEHSHSCNIHLHIGPLEGTGSWPYWMHMTGDVRKATFKVGNHVVHDRGHLTALDSPEVRAIAAKYPGRPGLNPEPKSY